MSSDLDMLVALDDLAYLVECAAVDHTGELKGELSALCTNIRNGSPPYQARIVQESLSALEECLNDYRIGKKADASTRLVNISRDWWNVVKSGLKS